MFCPEGFFGWVAFFVWVLLAEVFFWCCCLSDPVNFKPEVNGEFVSQRQAGYFPPHGGTHFPKEMKFNEP